MLREAVHLIAALQFSFAIYYFLFILEIPATVNPAVKAYGGQFKFLTYWNVIVQCFFFWICCINDFIGSNETCPNTMPAIREFKDKLFCSIALPLSVFVGTTFWVLYGIDRELILPIAMDPYFPTWFNHLVHTNVFIFPVIELLTMFREYPTRKECLKTLVPFMVTYLCWILFIYYKSGVWVYPIMEELNWPLRIAFFLFLMFFIIGIQIGGEKLNQTVWSKELEKAKVVLKRKVK